MFEHGNLTKAGLKEKIPPSTYMTNEDLDQREKLLQQNINGLVWPGALYWADPCISDTWPVGIGALGVEYANT